MVPPEGTAVHRCVDKVKAKGSAKNAYAVCQASTGQSYATGKPLSGKKSRARSTSKRSRR